MRFGDLVRGDHCQSIGFSVFGAQLGDEPIRSYTHRHRETGTRQDATLDLTADGFGWSQQLFQSAQIQIGLVNRDGFDNGCDRLQDLEMEEFESTLMSTARGAVQALRVFTPELIAERPETENAADRARQTGTFTFVLSLGASMAQPGWFSESVSQHAVLGIVRAAAIEQLEIWGERTGCKVIKHAQGA